MGDKKTNTGFVKVTDDSVQQGATVGFHSVDEDWQAPQMNGDGQDWEFVSEEEALAGDVHGTARGGASGELTAEDIADQIADLQLRLDKATAPPSETKK